MSFQTKMNAVLMALGELFLLYRYIFSYITKTVSSFLIA